MLRNSLRSVSLRRTLLTSVTCAALAISFSNSADAHNNKNRPSVPVTSPSTPTPPPPAPTPQLVRAVPAAAFLDSLGVNTHFNYTDPTNAYSNTAMMESELSYAGFRYARDTISGHWPLAILQNVNSKTGVKFDLLVGSDDYPTELADFRANTKIIGEVEGANEIDNWPITFNKLKGNAAAVAFQQQIYTDIKGSSTTSSIPVDSFTVSNNNYSSIPSIAKMCDYSAAHIYTQWGGNLISGDMEWSVDAAATDAPGKPSVITEFGWWTAPMSAGVSAAVQAKYALTFFLSAYATGTHRSYMYELSDEMADPQNSTIERHFGLFQSNGAAKPAATAMHNFTAFLADPTPTSNPGSLALTVTSAANVTINHLLMERGDGVYILALWQDAALWDNTAYKEIAVFPQQALINFGVTGRVVQVYDPMVGLTPVSNLANLGGMTQMVPDHPVFIFIQP